MTHQTYMDKTITWQAHSVMRVEQECLSGGFFPNGKRMTAKDREESKAQIEICKQILSDHGIYFKEKTKGQLELFWK